MIHVIIDIIILSPVLWIAGRWLAGKDKAKFTDALWISILGTVLADLLGIFIVGFVAGLIVIFIWIALMKYFFDCRWLKANAIGIVALIVLFVIALILELLEIPVLTLT